MSNSASYLEYKIPNIGSKSTNSFNRLQPCRGGEEGGQGQGEKEGEQDQKNIHKQQKTLLT